MVFWVVTPCSLVHGYHYYRVILVTSNKIMKGVTFSQLWKTHLIKGNRIAGKLNYVSSCNILIPILSTGSCIQNSSLVHKNILNLFSCLCILDVSQVWIFKWKILLVSLFCYSFMVMYFVCWTVFNEVMSSRSKSAVICKV